MNIIEVKELTKVYSGRKAVDSISFEIKRGEVFGLLGPNGAGKSTTLKAISGVVKLSSGEIWYSGKRIDKYPAQEIVELGIAHVPEGRRLFGLMNQEFMHKVFMEIVVYKVKQVYKVLLVSKVPKVLLVVVSS